MVRVDADAPVRQSTRAVVERHLITGIASIRLVTNNPKKIEGLVSGGIVVRRRIASTTASNPHNVGYLRTKRERSGHLIDLLDQKSSA